MLVGIMGIREASSGVGVFQGAWILLGMHVEAGLWDMGDEGGQVSGMHDCLILGYVKQASTGCGYLAIRLDPLRHACGGWVMGSVR